MVRARTGGRSARKVGPARTPGERDGLTKAQAEERFRKMREAERPAHQRRARDDGRGRRGALAPPRDPRAQEVHRLTVASDLRNHIAPFFGGKELDKIEPRDIERYIAVKLKTLAPKTVRNHLNTMHSVFEIGLRMGWCQRNPVKLADRPVIKTHRDADQVPRPARTREAPRPPLPRRRVRARSSRRST